MIELCVFLCAACYFDYRQSRIPNRLIIPGLVIGLFRAYGLEGGAGLLDFLIHAAVVIAAFYPLFRIGTIGAGDIKLFGLCAGYIPGDKILYFLFITLTIAAIISLIRFVRKADFRERFLYLFAYLKDVADSGEWHLYWTDMKEQKAAGICMAGPVLLSVLIYAGGFY